MHKYSYIPAIPPKPSKAIEVLIVVTAILVFASWGAMLAYYG